MQNLDLKKILKKNLDGVSKVAILGVGSPLRADDAAGTLVAEAVDGYCRRSRKFPNVKVFFGETAPENLTGEIRKFEPSHLIILDAADTSAKPGTIQLITPEEINGISFSTHQMPLYVLVDYLKESLKSTILIIGIQPKVLQFGKPVSATVSRSVKQVSEALIEAIKERCTPLQAKQ